METQDAGESFSFAGWLRTGRLIRTDARWGAREVKFNPNHDPRDGRFTFTGGGGGGGESGAAGMSRSPRSRQTGKGDGTWGGGGFTGGGGGLAGGGGATGYYMTYDEVRAYQRQHPGRDPYLAQPGDTVESIAAAHGLTVGQVRDLNRAASAGRMKPGQAIALPAGSLQHVEKNGYAFGIDSVDRTHEAKGELYLADGQERSRNTQRQAGGADRRATDDGGHFIAARFGGPADAFNHFAQNANFNRGGYRALEDTWAKDLRSGKHVSVDIVAHYKGASRRPDLLNVRWSINGRPQQKFFVNEPKGATRD